jgi:hypothetical protein
MGRPVSEIVKQALPGDPADIQIGKPTIGAGWSIPKSVREGSEFHWFHPPASGTLMLAVLSVEPMWYLGHYDRGRMRPCKGDDCEMCLMLKGRQVRFVFCCVDLETRRKGFLEVGSTQGDQLCAEARKRGLLRGILIGLSREARRKNAPLVMDVIRETTPAWVQSEPPLDTHSAMIQTWARAEVANPSPKSSRE